MIEMTDAEVQKFKQLYKRQYGVNYTDEQAREAHDNLVGFFSLLLEVDRRNKKKNSDTQGGVS